MLSRPVLSGLRATDRKVDGSGNEARSVDIRVLPIQYWTSASFNAAISSLWVDPHISTTLYLSEIKTS